MNKLSILEKRTPCYDIQGENVSWKPGCDGYRLPTEAEWEYAARAGSVSAYSFGDDAAELNEYAWYVKNAGGKVYPVGTRKPNAWGLHDMHGNVWEWVWDWYGSYSETSLSNLHGPSSGEYRLLRGGSFVDGARLLRSASRGGDEPRRRFRDDGVRCARGGAPALSP